MHLKEESCPGGEFLGHALGELNESVAGDVSGQCAGSFPLHSIHAGENENVMNYAWGGRSYLRSLYPSVLGEIGLHLEIDVGHDSRRLYLNFARKGEYDVWLSYGPLGIADLGEGCVSRVSFGFPVFYPSQ